MAEVVPAAADDLGADEILRLAASLDQVSPHVLAGAVVRAAHARGLELRLPTDVEEQPGRGVSGALDGRRVEVGSARWLLPGPLPAWAHGVRRSADLDGALTLFVRVDGEPAGGIVLDDPIRPDAARTVRRLRRGGVHRVVMVTGDRADVANTVGAVIGVDEVLAERSPAEKVDAVIAEGRDRAHDHGGRRDQRRARPRLGRCRRGRRSPRRHRVVRSRRRGPDRRPPRPTRRRHRHRPPVTGHRPAERGGRHRPVADGDGLRRPRLPPADLGRRPAGGDRRRRDPERPPGPAGARVRGAGRRRGRSPGAPVQRRAPNPASRPRPSTGGRRPDRRPPAGPGAGPGPRGRTSSWSRTSCPTKRPRTPSSTRCSPRSLVAPIRRGP